MPMRRTALTIAAILTMPSLAHAGTCEDTFTKSGSPISGLRFIASIAVADLTPASAIGQLRGIALPKGYDVLVEEANEGSMLIEQPMTGNARAFPITVTAVQAGGVGTVRLEARLRAGMFVKEAPAMTEMCSLLNPLKGGRTGLAAAAASRSVVGGGGAPVAMNALAFSHQISKDTERNSASVPLRYRNKRFTISGMVDYITRDGEYYRVAYKVPNPWEEALRLPNTAPFKTDISCLMASGQAAYALTLKPDRSIRLTGTWHEFDEFRHVVWLKDCRPER
jgi:hypothetical protein